MNKATKKRRSRKALPDVVRKHHFEPQYLAGDLTVEIGDDPDHCNQKVTRLRRKCVYDEMMNRGSISKEQRDCAERYAILCEKAFGRTSSMYARISTWLTEGKMSGGSWDPGPMQHEAYGRLFRIWQELGRYHRDILNMIILGNMSNKEIAEKLHLNLNYMMGQVSSAFILLEETMENR